MEFKSDTPCNNCPYRVDATRQLWHREEFKKLLANDDKQWAPVYACHKNNGCICVGWLMDQDRRNHPNLNLRMMLSKKSITREYLDSLHCPSEMYKSIEEMVKANYEN